MSDAPQPRLYDVLRAQMTVLSARLADHEYELAAVTALASRDPALRPLVDNRKLALDQASAAIGRLHEKMGKALGLEQRGIGLRVVIKLAVGKITYVEVSERMERSHHALLPGQHYRFKIDSFDTNLDIGRHGKPHYLGVIGGGLERLIALEHVDIVNSTVPLPPSVNLDKIMPND